MFTFIIIAIVVLVFPFALGAWILWDDANCGKINGHSK
jgi:hypothetical protein